MSASVVHGRCEITVGGRTRSLDLLLIWIPHQHQRFQGRCLELVDQSHYHVLVQVVDAWPVCRARMCRLTVSSPCERNHYVQTCLHLIYHEGASLPWTST
jgi:hypothetical protein